MLRFCLTSFCHHGSGNIALFHSRYLVATEKKLYRSTVYLERHRSYQLSGFNHTTFDTPYNTEFRTHSHHTRKPYCDHQCVVDVLKVKTYCYHYYQSDMLPALHTLHTLKKLNYINTFFKVQATQYHKNNLLFVIDT